jgi:hypothetical protein
MTGDRVCEWFRMELRLLLEGYDAVGEAFENIARREVADAGATSWEW